MLTGVWSTCLKATCRSLEQMEIWRESLGLVTKWHLWDLPRQGQENQKDGSQQKFVGSPTLAGRVGDWLKAEVSGPAHQQDANLCLNCWCWVGGTKLSSKITRAAGCCTQHCNNMSQTLLFASIRPFLFLFMPFDPARQKKWNYFTICPAPSFLQAPSRNPGLGISCPDLFVRSLGRTYISTSIVCLLQTKIIN